MSIRFLLNCVLSGTISLGLFGVSDISVDKQNQMLCGRNGIFVLSRLDGFDLTYEDIVRLTPVSSRGSSLRDLQAVLAEFGVSYEVLKLNINQAKNSDRAFLALFKPDKNSGSNVGHFVVVSGYDVESNRMVTIDGTTGRVFSYTMQRFVERWSGYVLVSTKSRFASSPSRLIISIIGMIGVLVIGVVSWRQKKTR